MRKIIITESQFKTVIDKFINEATKSLEDPITYSLGRSFPSGQFQITNTTDIDNAITQFKSYLGGGGIDYEIIITSSESKVPNETVGLKPGQLSEKRAEEVKNYLISKGFTPEIIKIDNKGAQGPEWDRKLGSKWEGYTKFQYVNLTLNAAKKPEPQTVPEETGGVECLTNLEITVNFEAERKVPHRCDDALFMLTANGVPIKNVDRGDNIIWLNNANDGGNRYNNLLITAEDAQKVLSNGQKQIKLIVYCMVDRLNGCHSDPLLIGIKNGKGEEIMTQKFITLGKNLRHREGKHIMTLNPCGKVLNADLSTVDELVSSDFKVPESSNYQQEEFELVKKRRSDEYTEESLAELYKYLNPKTKQIIIPQSSLVGYMRGFKMFNYNPWNRVKEYYDISDEQQQKLDQYMKTKPELYTKAQQEKILSTPGQTTAKK